MIGRARAGGMVALLALVGCSGSGEECSDDEAGDIIEFAHDMGVLTPIPLIPELDLVAEAILQTETDVDWFTFVVEDPWMVVWRPRIRLRVLAAPGTAHTVQSYSVEVFNHEGRFVGELDGNQLKLKGSGFFDDGLPYYIKVQWSHRASAFGEGESARFLPWESPTPSTTPSATATETPSLTPSATADPTPSGATPPPPEYLAPSPIPLTPPAPGGMPVVDNGFERCSRYVLRITM